MHCSTYLAEACPGASFQGEELDTGVQGGSGVPGKNRVDNDATAAKFKLHLQDHGDCTSG